MNFSETINTQLFIRIFPYAEETECSELYKKNENKNYVYIPYKPDLKGIVGKPHPLRFWRFQADRLFQQNSQDEVYEVVMKDVVTLALQGNDVLVIGNGQTASGKTYTINGIRNPYRDRGLIPRLISEMYAEKDRLKGVAKVAYTVSYVEFSKDSVRDLLEPCSELSNNSRNPLGEMRCIKIHNIYDGLTLLFQGEARRKLNYNSDLEGSNIAHAVFTINTYYQSQIYTNPILTKATIHVVDLAGIDVFDSDRPATKSARDINLSNITKCHLTQYLNAISKVKPSPDLYRKQQSMLIKYLDDVLNTKTVIKFIGHIRPTKEDMSLTLSTLKFCTQIRGFKSGYLCPYVDKEPTLYVHELENEILRLQKQLELNKIILNQESIDNISDERVEQMKRLTVEYLQERISEITFTSATTAAVVVQLMRKLYKNLEANQEKAIKEACQRVLDEAGIRSKASSRSKVNSGKKKKKNSPRDSSVMLDQISVSSTTRKPPATGRLDPSAGITAGKVRGSSARGSVTSRIATPSVIGSVSNEPKTKRDAKNSSKKKQSSSIKSEASIEKEISRPPSATIAEENEGENEEEEMPPEIPPELPSYNEAWGTFIELEDWNCINVKELQQLFLHTIIEASEKHKEYTTAITTLDDIRMKMELAKCDLMAAQHARHASGNDYFDEEGRIVLSDSEKEIKEAIGNIEMELDAHKIYLSQLYHEHRALNDRINISKYEIDGHFQEYCKEIYKTAVAKVESEVFIPEPIKEPRVQTKEALEILIYDNLQKEFGLWLQRERNRRHQPKFELYYKIE